MANLTLNFTNVDNDEAQEILRYVFRADFTGGMTSEFSEDEIESSHESVWSHLTREERCRLVALDRARTDVEDNDESEIRSRARTYARFLKDGI